MVAIGALIGAASYFIGFLIEKYIFKKNVKFNVFALTVSIIVGAVDGFLSFAKVKQFVGCLITFLMEFFTSSISKDNIVETFCCAAFVALTSMCLTGTKMLSFEKSNYYSKKLIKKLKTKNWEIIKHGVKVFFVKISKHLKSYLKNSSICAIISLGTHSASKAGLRAMQMY
jgi:hypothetical protein